ncbi:unnamed protein product [Tilletia caries]|nr:unnamed protein product [Tilletia caries]CAD6924920.1 unnamed protein product [Tilletia caries]
MEISITPATPAHDQLPFPSTTFTLTPVSPAPPPSPPQHESPPSPGSITSASTTTIAHDPAAINTAFNDIAAAIDNVRSLLFHIQEQRHLHSFSTVTTTSSATAPATAPATATATATDTRSPPASVTSSSRTPQQPSSELDRSIIRLDSQLEHISTNILNAESQLNALLTSDDQQPDQLRALTRARRDSRTSLSSLASFNDALLHTGTSATSFDSFSTHTPIQLQQRFHEIQQDYVAVTTDADMLKRELSEDKYLLVFRSVSDQADNMMTSLHKAITLSQDFINAYRASQQQQQQQHQQIATSASRLSLDGNDGQSPESQLEDLRALKKTFDVKTSYYGPACEQVFHVLERGIKDKATSNGTILHRYADLKMRWKSTREAILRTDRDLTKMERHLCKVMGMAELPAYSAEVQQHFRSAGTSSSSGLASSPARGRQDSAASGAGVAGTPPRLHPKSSQRTLRHVTSHQASSADGSFSSSINASPGPKSPPAPAKPPRSELRRAPSSQRMATAGAANGAGAGSAAVPIPGRYTPSSGGGGGYNRNQPSSHYNQQPSLSSSVGNVARNGGPHRRSFSASTNEPMADVGFRRANVVQGQGQGQGQHPTIPVRAGSRAGSSTPLGTSSSFSSNPFKHTGAEYSYTAVTSGRNLGAGGFPSPRRAHSPTHPPSSYRLTGSTAGSVGSGPGTAPAPRSSKTPQPQSQSQQSGSTLMRASSRNGERGASEPPENARPGSRASASGRMGGYSSGAGAGVFRGGSAGAPAPAPAHQGRGRADSRAFDDAMEDLSIGSYEAPPAPRSASRTGWGAPSGGGAGMTRPRPASSMAGYYYHPPAAHGHQASDSHIPRLAVGAESSTNGSSGTTTGTSNGRSPANSFSSLPGRPGSSMSQTSSSTTGFVGAGPAPGPGPSRLGGGSRTGFPPSRNGGGGGGGGGPSRLTMQTPEPVLAAQVKRLSMFARPSTMSQQQQHQQIQQAYANANANSGAGGSGVRKSSRPPPARLNNPSRTGRTTPLSAAALAAVPQANPALAWMSSGSGGGPADVHSSPSQQSSSSVAAYRAQQRANVGHGGHNYTSSSLNNNRPGAETPLSESSFGGQSVGGWGVRPSTATAARAPVGTMSSATGGARGGAGQFDVYVPNARDALDVAVAEVVNALGVAIERVDEGLPRGVRTEVAPGKDLQARYSIAGKTVACKLLMLHRPAGGAGMRAGTNVKKLLVRVGGGWQDFEGWISASILGHLDY